MTRAKSGVAIRTKRKRILKMAKGYRGRAKNCYTIAVEKVEKALQYVYRDRRNRKRQFRNLWIQRINAGVREHGMVYSQFIRGLKLAGIDLDRKNLSEIAINNPVEFKAIVDAAKAKLVA